MKRLVSTVCLLLLGSAPFAAWAEINNEQAALLKKYKCLVCHGLNNTVVGPSFADISKRAGSNDIERLVTVIRKGSVNVWSNIPMAPTRNISDDDARSLARWIAGLNPSNAVLAAREAANDFVPAVPEIFVLELSQFENYSGPDVSKIGAAERGVDSAAFDRRRLGSVQLAPGLRVFVDKLTLPGRVEYELIDALSGLILSPKSRYSAIMPSVSWEKGWPYFEKTAPFNSASVDIFSIRVFMFMRSQTRTPKRATLSE